MSAGCTYWKEINVNIDIDSCVISDDKRLLQIDRLYEMLQASYWAKERPKGTVRSSIEHSLCFGVYYDSAQIGFARCVTDYATVYYLCDVIVDENYRGQGVGKALVKYITEHARLAGIMGVLGTRDAHGLYEQFGFTRDEGMYRPPDQD